MKNLLQLLLILLTLNLFSQTQVTPPSTGIQGGPSSGDDGIVGNLKGTYSTSPSGAMIYSIPIITPKGPGGLAPNLSIVYNSQAGNGLMGKGWNISGLSAITRTGENFVDEGDHTGIQFNPNDKFVLDGNKLELNNITGNGYGDDGATYFTKIETYAKITSYKSTSTNSSPDYFIVETPDGSVYEYGNSNYSRIETNDGNGEIKKWLLNKVTNADGFFMVFNYSEDNTTGEVYINDIIYSGNNNLSPIMSIENEAIYRIFFNYSSNRVDEITGYVHGNKSSITKVLEHIEVHFKNVLKYKYDFTYTNSSIAPYFSYLENINLTAYNVENDDGTWISNSPQHYNPIEINWSDEGNCSFGTTKYESPGFSVSDGYTNSPSSIRLFGDFNGDGITDILGVEEIFDSQNEIIDAYFKISLGSLSSSNHFSSKSTWMTNSIIENTLNINSLEPWSEEEIVNTSSTIFQELLPNFLRKRANFFKYDIEVSDINGDGLSDIVGFNEDYTIILISTGNGFSPYNFNYFNYDYTFQKWDHDNPRYLADVNADGRADIIGFGDDDVYVSLSNGNNFNAPTSWASVFCSNQFADPNESEIMDINRQRSVADVNGDGMMDIVGFGYGAVTVYLSDGNSFNSGYSISDFTPDNGWEPVTDKYHEKHLRRMADVNGDGLADIVGFADEKVYVSLSTGTSFLPKVEWANVLEKFGYKDYNYYHHEKIIGGWELVESTDNNYSKDDLPATKRFLADVNGDGMADIIGFNKSGVEVGLSTGHSFEKNIACGNNGYWHTSYDYDATWSSFHEFPRYVVDLNGDGSSDIIGFGYSNLAFSYSNKKQSRVSKIIDSFDNEEYFEYEGLTNSSSYTKENNATYPLIDYTGPLYVLTKYIDNINNITYEYTGAKIHRRGKGFLGFIKKEIRQGSLLVQETTNKIHINPSIYSSISPLDYDYIMVPSKIKNFGAYGLINESEIFTKVENLIQSGSGIYHYRTYTNKTFTNEYFQNSSGTNPFKRSILTENTINSEGAILTNDVYISDNLKTVNDANSSYEYHTNTTNIYESNVTSPYLLNRLKKSTTTKSSPQSVYLHKVEYTYSPSYEWRIMKKTETPNNNSNLAITTTYSYDGYGFGNIYYKSVSAPNLDIKSEEYFYDYTSPNYGRFLTKTKNSQSNFETLYDYELVTGNLVKETDINGFIAQYVYNNFGELQKTINPDGTEVHTVLRWSDDGNLLENQLVDIPSGSLYYTWACSSGNSPIINYNNSLGKTLRNVSINYNGLKVYQDFSYTNNNKTFETEPYLKGDNYSYTRNWTYDYNTHQVLQNMSNGDNYIEIEYNGDKISTSYMDINNYPTVYKTESKTIDIFGNTIKVTDTDNNTISYSYDYSTGNLMEVSSIGATTSFSYDDNGNRVEINDPNAGSITTEYNAYNELVSKTDARGIETGFVYDEIGRLVAEVTPSANEHTEYEYDNAPNTATSNPPTTKGLLASVRTENDNWEYIKSFKYDKYNRKAEVIENHNGREFDYSYSYDWNSRLIDYKNPTDIRISYAYNNYGYLSSIYSDNANMVFWERNISNAHNQTTNFTLSNGQIPIEKVYDSYSFLTGIKTGTSGNYIQDLRYEYNHLTGNLINRNDNVYNNTEEFTYDNLDRLEEYFITDNQSSPVTINLNYSNNGNIQNKTDVGTYNYTAQQPNALTAVTNPVDLPNEYTQITEFNHFNKINKIIHESEEKEMSFFYNSNKQRAKTVYHDNQQGIEIIKHFVGSDYELKEFNGDSRGHSYIYSPDGLVCIIEDDGHGNILSKNIIITDHLGSIYAVTDETGTIKNYNGDQQIFSYDPWGKRRDFEDWTQPYNGEFRLFDRGYTGHEMLDQFDIINMNGRIYDPVVARFFSPDPFVQAPSSTQNYNRYSYVLNNPLKYTDPSGDFFLGTALTFVIDGWSTVFNGGINGNRQIRNNAWRDFDPFHPRSKTNKAFRIDAGLMIKEFTEWAYWQDDINFMERLGEIKSKLIFTEVLQSTAGYYFAHYQNLSGNIDRVDLFQDRTIIRLFDANGYNGVSLGHYVFGVDMALNPDDVSYNVDLFAHEFGHTYQSRSVGWLYLFKYGIPSAVWQEEAEWDANQRAFDNLGIDPWGDPTLKNELRWWESASIGLIWPFMWVWN